MWTAYFIRVLQHEFDRISAKNPSYSLRAYAKKLALSPGALSEIMSRKRPISRLKALSILEKLEIDEAESKHLRALIQREVAEARVLLSDEAFEFISNGHYFAILSALDLDQPPKNCADIAQTLGLPLGIAEKAIERLLSYNLIEKDKSGNLLSTGISFSTTEDIPSDATRKLHSEGFELARKALTQLPVTEREFTSIIFDGSRDCIKEGKAELRKFRDEFVAVMQGPKRDAVYRLCIQLFPLTSLPKKTE